MQADGCDLRRLLLVRPTPTPTPTTSDAALPTRKTPHSLRVSSAQAHPPNPGHRRRYFTSLNLCGGLSWGKSLACHVQQWPFSAPSRATHPSKHVHWEMFPFEPRLLTSQISYYTSMILVTLIFSTFYSKITVS